MDKETAWLNCPANCQEESKLLNNGGGAENAGRENDGRENAGHENAGMKYQDTKEHTSGERLRQNRLSIDLAINDISVTISYTLSTNNSYILQPFIDVFKEITNHVCTVLWA